MITDPEYWIGFAYQHIMDKNKEVLEEDEITSIADLYESCIKKYRKMHKFQLVKNQ